MPKLKKTRGNEFQAVEQLHKPLKSKEKPAQFEEFSINLMASRCILTCAQEKMPLHYKNV